MTTDLVYRITFYYRLKQLIHRLVVMTRVHVGLAKRLVSNTFHDIYVLLGTYCVQRR